MLWRAFSSPLAASGTILAVTGVMVFLVSVAVPLFRSADVEAVAELAIESADPARLDPLRVDVDEYRVLGWSLYADGTVRSFRLDDGRVRSQHRIEAAAAFTSASFSLLGSDAILGTAGGTLHLAEIGFVSEFLADQDVPPGTRAELESSGAPVDHLDGVLQLTTQGQYRFQHLVVTAGPTARAGTGAVRRLHHVTTPRGLLVIAVVGEGDDEKLVSLAGRQREDFMTGEVVLDLGEAVELPLEERPGGVGFLALNGTASDAIAAWRDGTFQRVRLAKGSDQAFVAERGSFVEDDAELTALTYILGDNTLVWGDSAGRVRGGFLVRLEDGEFRGLPRAQRDARARFGFAFAKELSGGAGAAVASLACSRRSRILAAGFDDGHLEFFNVSNEERLASYRPPAPAPVVALAIAPKEDGVFALTAGGGHVLNFDPHHAEATLGSLFTRQWYECYPAPEHTWQSSSGHTGFEPKLGLMPLVIGTLKATLYSMIFGAPLAISGRDLLQRVPFQARQGRGQTDRRAHGQSAQRRLGLSRRTRVRALR